jgi:hypothetical protein
MTSHRSATDLLFAELGGNEDLLPSVAKPAPSIEPEVTAATLAAELHLSSLETRALSLLGSGCNSESVAAALGVHPSRISQLLASGSFSKAVSELRYRSLQKHNSRDNAYDALEDRLLEKMTKAMPLLIKPESILRAINIVNQAKRRGSSAPEQLTTQQNIVTLILPQVITNKFTVNIHNQVTRAGDQELMTIASKDLLRNTEAALEVQAAEIESCTELIHTKVL